MIIIIITISNNNNNSDNNAVTHVCTSIGMKSATCHVFNKIHETTHASAPVPVSYSLLHGGTQLKEGSFS